MDLLMMPSTEYLPLITSAYASAGRQVSWYIPQSLQTSAM
jgi:hypothetical protein